MAYYRCMGGNQLKPYKVVVTCESVFAGLNISMAQEGQTTLVKQCPISAPYEVTFYPMYSGTWEISGTITGTKYSITQQLSFFGEYNVTLNATPNGATVTPINNIQTWLKCGKISGKSYTTINQVLSDSATLNALIQNNNAADYMARSTNWASSVCANSNAMTYIGNNDYCANKLLDNSTWLSAICNSSYFEKVLNVKVPTMTSDTTPSGEVISIGYYPGQYAWNAFNGRNSTPLDTWAWEGNGTNVAYIGYKFTAPTSIKKVYLENRAEADPKAIKSFIVQGSNNGTQWTDITSELQNKSTAAQGGSDYEISNRNSFLYYRVFVKSVTNKQYVGVGKLQFYGRA